MTIFRATPDDAALLATHRAAVWQEVGGWSAGDLTPQIPVWTEFFRDCITNASYVAFIAKDSEHPIGSGAILIQLTIPRPASVSDRAGRVHSVYVVPHRRRAGIARAIMEHLLAYARDAMLVSLSLHPSDSARPLYTSLGFQAANDMQLHLTI